MRIMAIDYGDAHTGIAISDPTGLLAGFTTVIDAYRPERVAEAVARLAQEHGAEKLVLGHPINMDGTRGPRSEKAQAMKTLLEEATGLPVNLFLSHEHGGIEQIGQRIIYNEIDMVLFFNYPKDTDMDDSVMYISRLCDEHSVPMATNVATAELLIHGLARGDLDWRIGMNPNRVPFAL